MFSVRLIVLLAATLSLTACATTVSPARLVQSYVLGVERSANVGEAFLVDQSGYIQTQRRWVGILNSPDGWQTEQVASRDYLRRELIYSGRSGNTIEIAYREYRGGLVAPAFAQSLQYDLSASNIIRFQRFEIEVVAADNQGITTKILRDR